MKLEKRAMPYKVFSIIILVILAFLFLFPLYWIVTGAFKTTADIYAPDPQFFPKEFTLNNFERLFAKRTAPAWEFAIPFSAQFSASHQPIYFSPVSPPQWRVTRWRRSVFAAARCCSHLSSAQWRCPSRSYLYL